MDPITPLLLLAAIGAAGWLGFRTARRRFRSADPMQRVSWKIVCYSCSHRRRGLEPDCQECRSARMRPLTKYQAEGGGTGFWIDRDGPLVSSLCEGEWIPSDDESDFPRGERHAPIFDLDFPAALHAGTLVLKKAVSRDDYEEIKRRFEGIGLAVRLEADPDPSPGGPHGIEGYRVMSALPEAVFRLKVPARLVPSSTPGHFHLYLDAVIGWEAYLLLMRCMAEAGLLEPAWVDMNEGRKMAMLRKPGARKAQSPY